MALTLAAPALGLQWLHTLRGSAVVADLLCLAVAAFYAFTVANVLGYVLGPGPVTGDKLHAAVAAYILRCYGPLCTSWPIVSSRARSASAGRAVSPLL